MVSLSIHDSLGTNGVERPETANNEGATGAFVLLFWLGIPDHPTMALPLGLLLTYRVKVGHLPLKKHRYIFLGVVTRPC